MDSFRGSILVHQRAVQVDYSGGWSLVHAPLPSYLYGGVKVWASPLSSCFVLVNEANSREAPQEPAFTASDFEFAMQSEAGRPLRFDEMDGVEERLAAFDALERQYRPDIQASNAPKESLEEIVERFRESRS